MESKKDQAFHSVTVSHGLPRKQCKIHTSESPWPSWEESEISAPVDH